MNNLPTEWIGSDEKVFEIEEKQKPQLYQSAKICKGNEPGSINIINQWGNTGRVNIREAITDKMLLDYIETFEQPRLQNFLCHLYQIAEKRFKDKRFIAKWLGISIRTLFRYNGNEEDLKQNISLMSREGLFSLLEKYKWNQSKVSRKLDIPLGMLRYRMKRFGISWRNDDRQIDSPRL